MKYRQNIRPGPSRGAGRKEEEGGEYTGAGCREDTGPHCRQNRRREERQTAVRGRYAGGDVENCVFRLPRPAPFRIFAPKFRTLMEIKGKFDHFNINVTDLARSIDFYGRALGLHEIGRQKAEDGSFELVFLGDGESNFHLELTWLRDKEGAYELGDNESHLCIRVAGDYDAVREFHRANGWVCFENHEMGLYFINDPDDYWIEVLPLKR